LVVRQGDKSAEEVAKRLDGALPISVVRWTISDLLDAASSQPELSVWSTAMRRRYLRAS
jgi:hypothetical protein